MLLLERGAILLGQLSLANNLKLGPDAHGIGRCADVFYLDQSRLSYCVPLLPLTVKNQFGTTGANIVDTASNTDLLALDRLSGLEMTKLFVELGVVVGDMKLVRVGIGLGIFKHCEEKAKMSAKYRRSSRGAQQHTIVDMAAANLKVLAGIKVLLLAGSVLGLARRGLGRGGSSLGGLVCLLLTLLLALLELRLGDALAGDLIEMEVRKLLGRWRRSAGIGHVRLLTTEC